MIILNILYLLVSAFVGYVIGRAGDYISDTWMNDPAWLPHHWIYGAILIIIAYFFPLAGWSGYIASFGVGVFISDLKDFWHFKFIGKDNKPINERRFWDIN